MLVYKLFEKIEFKYSLYKKGYGIKNCTYNYFYYVENINGIQEEMKIDCVQIDHGLSEIKLLPESEWHLKSPVWAKEKREKIITNIQLIIKNNGHYVFPE